MRFNIEDYSLLDEIGPEKVIFINNPSVDLNCILVIDNSVHGIPAGGVRLASDLTIDEMIRLARAMSLKFCTLIVFPFAGVGALIYLIRRYSLKKAGVNIKEIMRKLPESVSLDEGVPSKVERLAQEKD